ncbi:hypothetical protein SAMN05444921_106234 [Streptomyces wuyuanensis]|uniref:Uncharacterized protein n=1 Tax=Streptomyces wuyuanensis TaxID=1196353 RepID=A0A1G9S812_9ACTN|nr:hypothetical protein SAMN05444921_106234 [Streptomyces wuyuanensis]
MLVEELDAQTGRRDGRHDLDDRVLPLGTAVVDRLRVEVRVGPRGLVDPGVAGEAVVGDA